MLVVWFFVYKKLAQFAVGCALPPRRSESPGCAADNKPSCVLHLLGSFIGSRGFSSLEQRPEFWVLHPPKKQGMGMGRVLAAPEFPYIGEVTEESEMGLKASFI